jgi:U3 small nucleolar RNA-associated protein 10
LVQPPRHAIVKAAISDLQFASNINNYVLRVSKIGQHYPTLLAFWASIMTEAASGMLDKARSGRKDIQQQNEQDVILKLLPTLNEGLAMKKVADLRIACYMLLSVLASKGGLDDKLLTAMMEAVVLGWTTETTGPGLVCLSVLAQNRGAKQITKRVAKELLKVQDLSNLLIELSHQRRVDKLTNGFCLALVDRLRKSGDVTGLPFVVQMIESQLLSDAQTTVIVKMLLLAAHRIDSNSQTIVRSNLASSLVTITQLTGHVGSVIQKALEDTEVNVDELELKLHSSIRREALLAMPLEDIDMESPNPDVAQSAPSFSRILEQLPKRTTTEHSFLSHNVSDLYSELCQAFIVSTSSAESITNFDEIPILRRDSALEETLYLSFYARTWCGPYPIVARASALQMVNRRLSGLKELDVDIQALVPYAIAALGDAATKVRRAAADLLILMNQLYFTVPDHKKSTKIRHWASGDIYGPGEESTELIWLSLDTVVRLFRDLLVPALEECVLDGKHIESVFEKSINSPRNSESPKKTETGRLTQTARASVFSFLASHAINTPMWAIKLTLLASLNQVRGVANITRTKLLLPVLQTWASFSSSEVTKLCQNEHIELGTFDDRAVAIVTANDKDGLQFFSAIIDGTVARDRPSLIAAVFMRLRAIWPFLKGELRLHTAQILLDSSQSSTDGIKYHEAASEASTELLRTTSLSTDILSSFLAQLPTAAQLADTPPATKRRRTSHGEVARTPLQDSKQLAVTIKRVTFVLQLIDSSDPGSHPELLKSLFDILSELQHFKAQVSSELAYLQGLVIGSLLAIVQKYKSDRTIKLDRSAVRADLLVDCIQKTSSPQVQNAALLLISSLADTAPELVLHSVMPIFTFMGNSVLRRNDDYSAHVISQTIREVVPSLVASLRKEKGNPVLGAAELLLSFVAAYEHIPLHRRKALFTSLVQTLGAEDFLFALLAMLVDKYGTAEGVRNFAADLSSSFSVELQLKSAIEFLKLVGDVLKPKPTYSSVLLGTHEDSHSDPERLALNELTLLPQILSQNRLISQTARLLDRDDMDAARIRDLYSSLLEDLLVLADTVKEQKRLHAACGDVLESLLGLLSTSEFVKSVEGLLDRPNESLRRKILRSLEVRIDQESPSDDVSRVAMLGFLPQLTAIIRESKDVLYKHTAVACVDKISEKYGKMDLEAVAAAAETIASAHCLGQADNRLRVMALLCLASLVEILKEGIVLVLPTAIPKCLEYIEASTSNDEEAQKLHNAGLAFISSLIQWLPYMISGGYLERLLSISNVSAEADLDDEADESRLECLQLAAKQIDAKSMFNALGNDWKQVSDAGTLVGSSGIFTVQGD